MNLKSRYLIFSTVAFFLSSLTIFFMPLFPRKTDATMATILALAFWLFLIAGIIITVLLIKNVNAKGLPRILSFFKIKRTRIIDAILVISLLSAILTAILHINIGWLQISLMFLVIFTIELHCVFSLIEQKNHRRKENVKHN